MRGFTGFTHYGRPCLKRERYGLAHIGGSELERIEDALGMAFSDFDFAMATSIT